MAKKKESRRINVLDTSTIMYDSNAALSFASDDIAIPMQVLEELDDWKKSGDSRGVSAREFIRFLNSITQKTNSLKEWVKLPGDGKGRLKVIKTGSVTQAADGFGSDKNDHRILDAALALQEEEKGKAQVVLVSKDINLRLKAKSLDLAAEDYEKGKVEDVENIYRGMSTQEDVSAAAINKLYQDIAIDPKSADIKSPVNNSYYILRNGKKSALVHYDHEENVLHRIEKMTAANITPLNAEQVFALHAILNPNVKLVTLQGVAGTGKTLLALAGALQQKSDFNQIYLARPIVPLSNKDIGYLPGDIKSKINPYMEPLWDNLKFIKNRYGDDTKKEVKQINQMVEQEKLLITPLAYIRGRSISNVLFIVDEAQNLTPHEVKTIITRAGEGTKIIFTGDIYQVDTPYLDSNSNGLSYLIDKAKGEKLYAHVTLEKGERSELANLANRLL